MSSTFVCAFSISLLACNHTQSKFSNDADIVSSASPEATAAGVEILEANGNVIDALRIAHTSRRTKPVEDLIHFEDAVSDRISKEKAKQLLQKTERESSGETTHFSVVDADGMVVGVTASINAYYGAKVATPTLGFLYNDYMNEFEINSPGHPFAIRPNAMPYSSMSPTILAKDGTPYLVIGSPGSSRIISSVAQAIQLWVDSQISIAEAVSVFRVHVHPTTEQIRLYFENPAMAEKMHNI